MKNTVMRGAVLALLCSGAAQAEDLQFTLVNVMDVAVTGFYVSHIGTQDWEENLVPEGSVLAGGYEIDIVIADGRDTCEYDLLVEFEDGDALEDYNVNLCELESYTVHYE